MSVPRRGTLLLAAAVAAAAAICPRPSLARWAAPEEAPSATTLMVVDTTVNEDGSFEETVEEEILILNERGRQDHGTLEWTYNSRAGRVEVLAAETRLEDRTIPVAREFIEDKPIASNVSGFDQINQIQIAYPNAVVGSRVYLKYRETRTEVPFPGHYSVLFEAGDGHAARHMDVRLRSRRPLKVRVNDPLSALDVTHGTGEGFDTVRIRLAKPVFVQLADEDGAAFIRPEQIPSVAVSTHEDFAEMAKGSAGAWESVVGAPLPAGFDDILAAAAKEPDTVGRIDTVTSMLSERVRYWADWRPINGGFVPRPLDVVAASRFGDCKDMAALTAAFLRRLGVRAEVAWVWRGSLPPRLPPLATQRAFNHAVVRATGGGKEYWIDPTNRVSYARGVPSDLADRYALVLSERGPALVAIPLPPPGESLLETDLALRFVPNGDGDLSGKVLLGGSRAIGLTGSGRYRSMETIRYSLLRSLAGGRRVISGTVGPFDALSIVVRDIPLDIDVRIEGAATRSTAGLTYGVDMRPFTLYRKIDPARDEGHFFLGSPGVYRTRETIENADLSGSCPKACTVDSPWVEASWEVRPDGRNIVIGMKRVQKRQEITRDEVRSKEFGDFQKRVRDCFGSYEVVFVPREAPAAP